MFTHHRNSAPFFDQHNFPLVQRLSRWSVRSRAVGRVGGRSEGDQLTFLACVFERYRCAWNSQSSTDISLAVAGSGVLAGSGSVSNAVVLYYIHDKIYAVFLNVFFPIYPVHIIKIN